MQSKVAAKMRAVLHVRWRHTVAEEGTDPHCSSCQPVAFHQHSMHRQALPRDLDAAYRRSTAF